MSKALKTAGMVIGAVALVATGIGAAGLLATGGFSIGAAVAGAAATVSIAGVSMSTLTAIGTGLAFLGDATAKPLRVGGVAGTQVDFAADPNAPIPYAVGRTGTGGRIIYATTGEPKNRNILYNTVLSGGAPLNAITGFKANGEEVTFGPLQQAIGGTYATRMWQNRQLGAMPSPAFGPPNTLDPAVLGEWTPAHKLSGYMASWYVLGYDQKTYANGVPKAVWTIEGACVYDPRLDSTYPGGSGAHRIDEPGSWTWSENPWLHALAWSLGRYANGVRVLGIGARKELIDIAAAVEGANIADANAWKVGGVVYSNDSKWDVLKAMCQAGGGRPVQLGASITFLVNTPRVALATLTPDDIVGGYSVQAAQSVRNRPNQIIPKYRSEEHNWEMVAAGPVKVAAYVTADRGRLRSREVSYPLVQDAKQVAQLAAYDLVNAREFGPVTVPCKPAWMGYKRGDCIMVAVPDLAMNGQKALILARTVDPMTGDVSLTLQSETDAKHDFALGRTASPPPIPGLTGVDPLPQAPANGSWIAVGTALAGEDGSQVPAIVVTGQSDDPNATNIIVEYRLAGGAEWAPEEFPATRKRLEIKGLVSEATYQVRVRYRTIRGLENEEVFLDLGAVVTGKLIAPDALAIGGVMAERIAEYLAITDQAVADAIDLRLRIFDAIVDAGGKVLDLKKELTPPSGRPVGATLDDQVRQVETARETIIEHYTEMTVGFENAAAGLATESIVRATQDEALSAFQVALATVVNDNYSTLNVTIAALTTQQNTTAMALTTLTSNFNGNVASVSSQLSTLSSAQSAQASSITTLSSTVGGHTSSISSISTTLATINGQLAAAWGVDVTVDGRTIGIKGLNSGATGGWVFDGDYFFFRTPGGNKPLVSITGSLIYFGADCRFGGNLVLDGSLTFSKIGAGEITESTNYSDPTIIDITTTNQSMGGYYVYCAAGDLDVVSGFAVQNNAGTDDGTIAGIYCDGSLIDSWPTKWPQMFTERDSQTTIIEAPGAGYHFVELKAYALSPTASLRKILLTLPITNRRR